MLRTRNSISFVPVFCRSHVRASDHQRHTCELHAVRPRRCARTPAWGAPKQARDVGHVAHTHSIVVIPKWTTFGDHSAFGSILKRRVTIQAIHVLKRIPEFVSEATSFQFEVLGLTSRTSWFRPLSSSLPRRSTPRRDGESQCGDRRHWKRQGFHHRPVDCDSWRQRVIVG
jgi:hypothetical protein